MITNSPDSVNTQAELQGAPNTFKDPVNLHLLNRLLDQRLNLGTELLINIAKLVDAKWKKLSIGILLIHWEGKSALFYGHTCNETVLADAISQDKHLTKILLDNSNLNTPHGESVSTQEEAIKAWESIDGPVVIKPRSGIKGRGITVGVNREQDVIQAFYYAKQISQLVLVEQLITGTEFRLLASSTHFYSAIRKTLPHVVGDGVTKIATLIKDKNTARRLNPHLYSRPIPVDSIAEQLLMRQGVSLDTVPPLGHVVTVRETGNTSAGAESIEASESLTPDVKRLATNAVSCIPGLDWAGIDIIISDRDKKPYILEMNTHPGIGAHHFPLFGSPKNIASIIWRKRFEAQRYNSDELNDGVGSVLEDSPSVTRLTSNQLEVSLGALLQARLEDRGFAISQVGTFARKSIWCADSDFDKIWFHGAMGVNDLLAVKDTVRRHRVVRRLLQLSDLPLASARLVKTSEDIDAFSRASTSNLRLVPRGGGWDSPHAKFLSYRQTAPRSWFRTAPRWVAQAQPDGVTVKVYASRATTFAATVSNNAPTAPGATQLAIAQDLAVRAVQSIPELRWAAVDILFSAGQNNHLQNPIIEGVVQPVKISLDSTICVGSLSSIADGIVGLNMR